MQLDMTDLVAAVGADRRARASAWRLGTLADPGRASPVRRLRRRVGHVLIVTGQFVAHGTNH
jgi:hypothetical protein